MTDVLIDKTTKRRHTLHRCFRCDHQKYPQGKVIMPYDKGATYNAKTGEHICGVCNLETFKKVTSLLNRHKVIE